MKRGIGLVLIITLLGGWKNREVIWSISEQLKVREVDNIVWHWEDKFTPDEKLKLETWLLQTTVAVEETLGKYPFKIHLYIHRKDHSSEPVPWANTTRHYEQGVHFHVDPSYTLTDFLEDWTAPHEISHLSIPYLGREEAWFAEGYATYLQCQVMYQMGYYTTQSLAQKYKDKRKQMNSAYATDKPFIARAKELGKQRRYPQMYWGSACFFDELNHQLKKKNLTLNEVINQYQSCCRMADEDEGLRKVLESWNDIIGDDLATSLWNHFKTTPSREIMED